MIKTINIPSAAAADFSNGDVRHITRGDSLDYLTLQGPTRHLAQRDILLADKLNEVISKVNNSEQYINVPSLRTTIPPGTSLNVENFRIPDGFEARVFNAAVSSSNSSVQLVVYFGTSFGGVAGTEVVNTVSEASLDTTFYPKGEFIIKLINAGTTSADVTASIVLTMRPVGDTVGDLISPGPKDGKDGKDGVDGVDGADGAPGSPGVQGPAGDSFVWIGRWEDLSLGASVVVNDTASYTSAAGITSSFICITNHTKGATPPSTDTANWSLMVNGATSNVPTFGSAARNFKVHTESNFVGFSRSLTSVTHSTTTATATLTAHGYAVGQSVTIANVAISGSTTNIPYNGTFTITSKTTDTFSYTMLSTPSSDADASTGAVVGVDGYVTPTTSGTGIDVTGSITETYVQNSSGSPAGMSILTGAYKFYFTGSITFTLPTISGESSKLDWGVSVVKSFVSAHGILTDETSTNPTVIVEAVGTNQFKVTGLAATAIKLLIDFVGISTF